jgi:hypothetical protein
MQTRTGMVVDVVRSKTDPKVIFLVMDGTVFPLRAEDAESIGVALRAEAANITYGKDHPET